MDGVEMMDGVESMDGAETMEVVNIASLLTTVIEDMGIGMKRVNKKRGLKGRSGYCENGVIDLTVGMMELLEKIW